MAFTVPFSSSPPSTPDSRSRHSKGLGHNSRSFASNLSTTPAGPPPSSTPARPTPSFTPSFTPAGPPPPASLFGSSHPTSSRGKILFNSKPQPLFSSPEPPPQEDDEMEEEDPDGEVDPWESEDISETGSMEIDEQWQEQPVNAASTSSSKFQESTSSAGAFDWAKYGSSTMSGTPRGMKRSRGGAVIPYGSPRSVAKSRAPKKESPIPKIAKNMATQLGVANLSEPDDLIMKTERTVSELYKADPEPPSNSEDLCAIAAQELSKRWRESRDQDKRINGQDSGPSSDLGPDNAAPGFHKAGYLGSLLLQLHHPPPARGLQAFAVSKFGRSSTRSSQGLEPGSYRPTAMPKVLLDWMEHNHNPYMESVAAVQSHLPNPTAHPLYWDIIFASTLRGKLSDVTSIFKRSNFEMARTAREEGQNHGGYSALTVRNIKRVVDRAVQALEWCPALHDGDWSVAGNEWILFRRRISSAIDDLSTFAEGRNRAGESTASNFEASNFGIKSTASTLSQSARRAESQVPWTVYQNLKAMYGIILGGTDEVIQAAQDWVEATIGLAVWWDGNEDEDIAVRDPAMARRSLRQSQSRGSRLVDLNPTEAYLRRLADAWELVTNYEKYGLPPIDTNNPVDVGLASVFEGNVEGVVTLLRGWSLPIASAVVEIGYLGSWYNPAPEQMDAFNESDLLVLSTHGNGDNPITRDELLVEYTEALAGKDQIADEFSPSPIEGWELSIQVLSRLDDLTKANRKRSELLQSLPLDSDRRIDKVLNVCHVFELNEDACRIAERYGDIISENTTNYGDALIYYARAHRPQKVKSVLDLLVSLCIVQSTAFPPPASLDNNLRALVHTPKESLTRLEAFDAEAASTLHQYLTGYATVRKFYDLRDEDTNAHEGGRPRASLQRKKEAAKALIAIINSAADNIYGGLHDETRGSVIHIDCILALLGEASVFVNHTPPLLTSTQSLSLLTAIESLQAVSPSIYNQCADCLTSTLKAYHSPCSPSSSSNSALLNPQDMLRKTLSSSSSGFSMVGSEMLASAASSGSLVKVGDRRSNGKRHDETKRGWDWRADFRKDADAKDLLLKLRLALARDMSRSWAIGDSDFS